MPRQYEHIRDSELAAGKSAKEAKRIAAATWNKQHPGNPITPHHEPTGNYAAKPVGFDASAPKAVLDLYHQHYGEHREAGHPHEEAHRRAIRMTQHAGWHKTRSGWKQLHSDLRDKVNIREAVRQPNGRYVIEDVPVFYPNAVKGKELPFGADDIRQIIDNTNRSINSGGQKPGLLEGHPNDLQAALGQQLKSHGSPVNFREHKKKPGWAVCDLIDVEPEYVKEMQARHLTGLSAGLAKDAGKLNRRFGHVALLGGTSQALSHLPSTEVFSVSDHYVCFSADTESFPKGNPMKLSDKHKACFAALHSAYEAYEAAEKSMELKEPESEKKIEEAYKGFSDAYNAFSTEMKPEPITPLEERPEGVPQVHGDPEPVNAVYEEGTPEPTEISQNPGTESVQAPMNAGAGQAPEFAADPEGAFNFMSGEVKTLSGKLTQLIKVNEALQTTVNVFKGKEIKAKFDADVEKLRKEGRNIPAKLVDSQFKLCFSAEKPTLAIATLIESLKAIPAQPSPAATGQVFSADEAGKNANKRPIAPVPSMDAMGVNMNFSAEDKAWAAIGQAVSESIGA